MAGGAAMVELVRVSETLRPWLGDELLQRLPRALAETERRLNAFDESDGSAARLAQSLEGLLYSAVEQATEGRFLVTLADGTAVRMEPDDFAVIADDLLGLLFSAFPTDAQHLMLLRDYAARAGSLSARRALFEHFSDYQTAGELAALRAQIREKYPEWRWQAWLTGGPAG